MELILYPGSLDDVRRSRAGACNTSAEGKQWSDEVTETSTTTAATTPTIGYDVSKYDDDEKECEKAEKCADSARESSRLRISPESETCEKASYHRDHRCAENRDEKGGESDDSYFVPADTIE